MLDLKTVRTRPDDIRQALVSRGSELSVDGVLALDAERRELLTEVESLKNQRNVVSKEIGARKKAGEDCTVQQEAMRDVGAQIGRLDARTNDVAAELDTLLLAIPNLPHPSVPVGPDASANRMVRSWGEPRTFSFQPRDHIELGRALELFDLERAARMSGAGFPLYTGQGSRLERALIQFMLDLHVEEHGYTEVTPPLLCTTEATRGTGQLPKLAEEMYHLDRDGLYLVPTAEVPLTNIYREEVIDRERPIALTAYTPCFRREAGAAGKDTRGLIRLHQFNKVEMVRFVEPGASYDELEALVGHAEDVLQRLGLPYRVVELCTGDLSFAAAKCYDIELWAPGQNDWLEVSSCSNFEDFQARRARIRYRDAKGKPVLVHTLNGSGVALPRLFVALLENYQDEDGSVVMPEALRPYLGGLERLSASG